MSRSFVTSLAIAALLLAGAASLPASARPHPAATASPTPIPAEDPAITSLARHEFVAWQAGIVDKNRYSTSMQARLSDEQIAQTSRNLSAVGALLRTQWLGPYPAPEDVPNGRAYLFHMICANDAVYELLTLGPDGKIAGIAFRDKLD